MPMLHVEMYNYIEIKIFWSEVQGICLYKDLDIKKYAQGGMKSLRISKRELRRTPLSQQRRTLWVQLRELRNYLRSYCLTLSILGICKVMQVRIRLFFTRSTISRGFYSLAYYILCLDQALWADPHYIWYTNLLVHYMLGVIYFGGVPPQLFGHLGVSQIGH